MEDLRKEAKLHKSDVYKGVGVDPSTYENWITGKTLPDVSKAAALARVLKTPLINIFRAFDVAVDDIISVESSLEPENSGLTTSVNHDMSALVSVLKRLPDDQAAVVMHWLVDKKKDGGPSPPSGMPT